MTSDFEKSMDAMIDAHAACNNELFDWIDRQTLRSQQLRKFGTDYFAWIRSFPGILGGLIANTRDPEFQFLLTEILYSELGSGAPERMHFKLFERILLRLGLNNSEIHAGPLLAETQRLIEGMRWLYNGDDILRGMGAQYALERQAFPMIQKLYVGFKHYKQLTREDFEYFELHLVEEPEHLHCMQQCMKRCVSGPGDVERAKSGALACLDLIAAFWRRMYKEIAALEAPPS